jgi:hypothetical protein
MIVFFGTSMYGKVDHVRGLFYVGTNFFYLQFVPLFPVSSILILDNGRNQGVNIGLNGKSIMFAYLRLALFIGGVAAAIAGLVETFDALERGGSWAGPIGFLATAVALFAAIYPTYRLSRPSPHRALWLAEQAGISMEVLAAHFAKMKPADTGLPTDDLHDARPADDPYRTDS